MNIEHEDKRTLVWAIWHLALTVEDKQNFEDRAIGCIDEITALAKYNGVLDSVMLSLPSDEEISNQAKQKYPYQKTKEGTYYEGKSKGYAEGANWMKFQIEKLNEA